MHATGGKMKEKTKKILAGIGLGAVLGTSGLFMAGCSSDITFNQSHLDEALKNVNEYLETQNNYSSEFAKNVLNDYLLRGIERNQNNSQFGYKVTNKQQNSLNDLYANFTIDYKIYRKDNDIKEMCNIDGGAYYPLDLQSDTHNYREVKSEYKQRIVNPGEFSTGKTYYYSGTTFTEDLTKVTDQYSKTTFEDKVIGEMDNWRMFGDLTSIYSDLMLAITVPESSAFGPGYDFTNQTDVVMGQDGEYETFSFTNIFSEEDGEIIVFSYNIKFKDGILQSVKFTNGLKDSYEEALSSSQVVTIEITEKIDDFTC